MEKMHDLYLIDQSIKKWQGIVYDGNINRGPLDCPLCQKYHQSACRSCPIKGYTGLPGCVGTPYHNFYMMCQRKHSPQEYAKSANLELSFLYEMRAWYINQTNQRKTK